MKGNISIIYIKTSQLSEEKIAVGAIGVFGSRVDVVISDEKLNFSFDLLQGKNKNFLIQNLNLFQNKINDLNLKSNGNTEKTNISVEIDKDYLSYLNSYSQGLIAFGTPMPVNIDSGDTNYYKAFLRKFVGNFSKEAERRNLNRIHLVDEDFLKEISIHSLQLSAQKIVIQKVIQKDTIGEVYEFMYLLNKLKNRIQVNIDIEVSIVVDKKSNLQLTKLEQIFKDFDYSFLPTNLSELEVGLVKNLRLENLLKEINVKKETKISITS